MREKRNLEDIISRLDILEKKVDIIETKVDETKNFAFDQIRDILLRLMKLENEVKELKLGK
ncbi:MAG: hypothetical protein DRP84_05515 [Spirochaetes bacterium]|nr:MAG: hypothetical protein DRP84_05515 [Spirochaetota bacterium]